MFPRVDTPLYTGIYVQYQVPLNTLGTVRTVYTYCTPLRRRYVRTWYSTLHPKHGMIVSAERCWHVIHTKINKEE